MRRTPELVPVLSKGKHRNPRKGACFMEFASYLAGEKWSDHPACTHPVLAGLARSVNDNVVDECRRSMVPMVPDVVGVAGDDPELPALLARLCALRALPVAAESRQRVLALGLLRCEQELADLQGRPGTLTPEAEDALADVPTARDWAQAFSALGFGGRRAFRRISAPAIVEYAVVAIAAAAVEDVSPRLVSLLHDSIALSRDRLAPVATVAPVATPLVPVTR
jgi:hypothetical protein